MTQLIADAINLHTWISQQVDAAEKRAKACDATDWRHVFNGVIVDRDTDGWQHAPEEARIASVAHEHIYWSTNPPYSPDADHIVHNDPDAVLRRCEADRRILARHRLAPALADSPTSAAACDGCGYEWVQDHCDPITDNINDCPELLDLAHAHGITPDILAGLDRPTTPEPTRIERPSDARRTISTSAAPAALRGPNWKP
ncbi:DUF6221 family protein [Streptomyces sp. CAU 1734]|uniref:DUF6221 family protein n=1 Tax=Streptomyces sp. CAU 1734 TaxID=3140360 RepID=UPI0032602196